LQAAQEAQEHREQYEARLAEAEAGFERQLQACTIRAQTLYLIAYATQSTMAGLPCSAFA